MPKLIKSLSVAISVIVQTQSSAQQGNYSEYAQALTCYVVQYFVALLVSTALLVKGA